jgi:hypothetical protein
MIQHDSSLRASPAAILASTSAHATPINQHAWCDYVLSADTTDFLITLSQLCKLKRYNPKPVKTEDPNLVSVKEAIGSMSKGQVEKVFYYLKHGRDHSPEEEKKARKYLTLLKRGLIPPVLAGGGVEFSLHKYRRGERRRPEFDLRIGSLSPETRARVYYEAGKTLVRLTGRERRAGRNMLSQCVHQWSMMNRPAQMARAEKLVERSLKRTKTPH